LDEECRKKKSKGRQTTGGREWEGVSPKKIDESRNYDKKTNTGSKNILSGVVGRWEGVNTTMKRVESVWGVNFKGKEKRGVTRKEHYHGFSEKKTTNQGGSLNK